MSISHSLYAERASNQRGTHASKLVLSATRAGRMMWNIYEAQKQKQRDIAIGKAHAPKKLSHPREPFSRALSMSTRPSDVPSDGLAIPMR